MARSGRGGSSRRGRKKKGDGDDFVRLTGLWKPDKRGAKQLGQGNVKLEDLQDLVERIEDKGGDGAFIYMFKNEYAESSRDPRYVLSALPLEERDDDDGDDEDERPRRRKKKSPPKRRKKRRDEEEDEDDDDLDDEDEDDEDDDDPPF
jgi:hypothetical protein